MSRLSGSMIVALLAGFALASDARAQIPHTLAYEYNPDLMYVPLSYKTYGWCGWGMTPRLRDTLASGMATYAQRVAQAQEEVRQEEEQRRRDEMIRRWNAFYWSAQHALNLAQSGGRLPENVREAAAMEAELARLRDRPEPEEIESGAALNALLDQLSDPRLPAEALRETRTRLAPKLIRQVPFEYASEVVTILLERLTADGRWPQALTIPALTGPRQALRAAIEAAVKEDLDWPLGEASVRAIHEALRDLAKAAVESVPPGTPQAAAAEAYFQELVGLARLIGRPDIDPILAALDEQTGATVEDLLGFLQMFNLRFDAATTPGQKEAYRALYPILSRWRSALSRRLGRALPQGGVTLEGLKRQAAPALMIFTTMDWEQLIGRRPGA